MTTKTLLLFSTIALFVIYFIVTGFTNSSSLDYTGRPTPARTFSGYTCTDDCSGHEAGYEWASEKGIDDPDDCGGNSQSFIEGCRAYAEELSEDYEY